MKVKARFEMSEMHDVGIFAAGQGAVGSDRAIDLAQQLITTYDSPYNGRARRDKAADLVTGLAMRYSNVLELVIQNALAYSLVQCIDDAFPYRPNSYDVLVRVGRGNDRVALFLEKIAREESSIPQSHALAAIRALQA